MNYKIGFDGVMSAELQKLLQSIEGRVNGLTMHVQTGTEGGASTVASGSPQPACPEGQNCPGSVKGGQDIVVVVVVAAVTGAVAGYIAGKVASSVKGGQD